MRRYKENDLANMDMDEQIGSGKNRLWQGILLGALAGAAISLLDKNTRKTVVESSKKCTGSVRSFMKNPGEFLDSMKDTSERIRHTIKQISEDVAFITQKVEDMKDVPSQVASVLKETKEAFTSAESTTKHSNQTLDKNESSSIGNSRLD